MLFLNIKKSLAVVAVFASISSVSLQAATVNPGAWVRGDAGSLYAEWDVFNAVTDSSPDIGSDNTLSAQVAETGGSSFISGGNIYAFGFGQWSINLAGDSSGPIVGDNATVYLQVFSRGSALNAASVNLGGHAATTSQLVSSIALGGFGGNEDTWLFSWTVPSVGDWSLNFAASAEHMSLAAVAVDIKSVIAAPAVPVPAAAWLFGSGVAGLASIAKRRKAY